jgi:hypothetical protein
MFVCAKFCTLLNIVSYIIVGVNILVDPVTKLCVSCLATCPSNVHHGAGLKID